MEIYRKFCLFFSLFVLYVTLEASQNLQTRMVAFEKGFKEIDSKILENLYLKDAVVISRGIKLEGNVAIAKQFREKGMEIVDVKFFATEMIYSNDLMYERGIFKDYDKQTGKEVGKGDYFVVWYKEKNQYKIKLHTWSEN